MKTVMIVGLLLVAVVCCGANLTTKVCETKVCQDAAQEIKSYMDDSLDPCQDFAGYVCGGFYKKEKIPDDLDTWNDKVKVERKTQEYFKSILEKTSSPEDPEYLQKMKKFYQLCTDEDTIEKVGYSDFLNGEYKSLWPSLNKDYDPSTYDLDKLFEVFEKHVIKSLFYYHVWSNSTDSDQMIMKINIMPRHIVAPDDDAQVKSTQKYYEEVAKELGADEKTAKDDAAGYVRVEKELRENIKKAGRQAPKTMTLGEMNIEYPFIDWVRAFNAVFRFSSKTVDSDFILKVSVPAGLKAISDYFINSSDKRGLQNYFTFWSVVQAYQKTTRKMRDLHYQIFPDTLGSKKQPERWRQCVQEINNYYSEGLAVEFSKKLPENIRPSILHLLGNIAIGIASEVAGLTTNISSVQRAFAKVQKMKVRIAYTDQMTEEHLNQVYSKYEIYDGNFAKTRLQNEREWSLNFLTRAGERRDKQEWLFGHTSLGRGYDTLGNVLSIAGVKLQPPFYADDYPRVVKLGSLGPLIGLINAFDTTGLRYNEDGNRGDILAPDDQLKAGKLINCYINQYSKFNISIISKLINGKQTIRNNFVDNLNLGVLQSAASIAPSSVLPDLSLTANQLFYVTWAKHFCSLETKERTLYNQASSSKTYDRFRIIGSLQNEEGFAKAFECKKDSPMNPTRKCNPTAFYPLQ